ncbi:MAG: hypothetical protein ACRYF4_09410 [Janthinobacterium lividum]
MADTQSRPGIYAPNYTGPRLFGAPVGDFSFLQTLLITGATGLASFFAATFLAIMTILVLTQAFHRTIDFSIAYKWFGLPVGILMLLVAAVYLGSLLVRRLRANT